MEIKELQAKIKINSIEATKINEKTKNHWLKLEIRIRFAKICAKNFQLHSKKTSCENRPTLGSLSPFVELGISNLYSVHKTKANPTWIYAFNQS